VLITRITIFITQLLYLLQKYFR